MQSKYSKIDARFTSGCYHSKCGSIYFRKAMLDIAIPQDTGYPVNGTGTAIEMCRDCPQGYEGYSCEECSQVYIYKSVRKFAPL